MCTLGVIYSAMCKWLENSPNIQVCLNDLTSNFVTTQKWFMLSTVYSCFIIKTHNKLAFNYRCVMKYCMIITLYYIL